ncbi:Guanylyl cyclase 1 [Linum perenne]
MLLASSEESQSADLRLLVYFQLHLTLLVIRQCLEKQVCHLQTKSNFSHCTCSVWTVDLAFLLKRFSVRFSYCTVTIGANPHFSVEKYYKEQLPTDLVRVDMLFEKASKEGIKIQCRSINEKQISCLILSGKYIIIALVNQYKLRYVISRMFVLEFVINWTCHLVGHYIVICGYDSDSDEFEIRDPASSRKHERISSKCLEEARKSFGTDEDLLLVN